MPKDFREKVVREVPVGVSNNVEFFILYTPVQQIELPTIREKVTGDDEDIYSMWGVQVSLKRNYLLY